MLQTDGDAGVRNCVRPQSIETVYVVSGGAHVGQADDGPPPIDVARAGIGWLANFCRAFLKITASRRAATARYTGPTDRQPRREDRHPARSHHRSKIDQSIRTIRKYIGFGSAVSSA
jgi:hypothetical protein